MKLVEEVAADFFIRFYTKSLDSGKPAVDEVGNGKAVVEGGITMTAIKFGKPDIANHTK